MRRAASPVPYKHVIWDKDARDELKEWYFRFLRERFFKDDDDIRRWYDEEDDIATSIFDDFDAAAFHITLLFKDI